MHGRPAGNCQMYAYDDSGARVMKQERKASHGTASSRTTYYVNQGLNTIFEKSDDDADPRPQSDALAKERGG